jgi:hypothetical protein
VNFWKYGYLTILNNLIKILLSLNIGSAQPYVGMTGLYLLAISRPLQDCKGYKGTRHVLRVYPFTDIEYPLEIGHPILILNFIST